MIGETFSWCADKEAPLPDLQFFELWKSNSDGPVLASIYGTMNGQCWVQWFCGEAGLSLWFPNQHDARDYLQTHQVITREEIVAEYGRQLGTIRVFFPKEVVEGNAIMGYITVPASFSNEEIADAIAAERKILEWEKALGAAKLQ